MKYTRREMTPKDKRHVLTILRKIIGPDGLSMGQKELAKIAGCSLATIQSVELGRLKLSEGLAEKIATVCGVSPDWLLANDRTKTPTAWPSGRDYTAQDFKDAQQSSKTKFAEGGEAISRWNLGFHLADLFACYVTAERRGVASAYLFRNRLVRLIRVIAEDYPGDGATLKDADLAARLQKAIGGAYPAPTSPAQSSSTAKPRAAAQAGGKRKR